MKTLSRRSSQPSALSCQPKTTSVLLLESCQPTAVSSQLFQILPLHLSKITNASRHKPAGKTSSSPDPRPNDATRRSCRAASAVASATARAAPLRKRPRLLRTTCSALSRRKSAAAAPTRRFASVGGGGERNRTDDLLLAKQALSQLSYTPSPSGEARSPRPGGLASIARRSFFLHRAALAAQERRCRGHHLRLRRKWWAREDLNLRPHAYQARALTN
jgi:hypothetical protein